MHRLLFASGNIVFSVLLGAIAMTVFALSYEEAFKHVLNVAEQVKGWLIGLPMPTRYNNFVRLFLHESSFVFAFFTIVSRIVVSAVGNFVMWLWRFIFRDPDIPVVEEPRDGHHRHPAVGYDRPRDPMLAMPSREEAAHAQEQDPSDHQGRRQDHQRMVRDP